MKKKKPSIFSEKTISLSKLESFLWRIGIPIPSRSKLHRLIKAGELRGKKIGNRFVVTEKSLFEWLSKTRQTSNLFEINHFRAAHLLTPEKIKRNLKILKIALSRQTILRGIHNEEIDACFDGNRYLVWDFSLYRFLHENGYSRHSPPDMYSFIKYEEEE